jgi:hypothetical protein
MAHFINKNTLQIIREGYDTEPYASSTEWVCNRNNPELYNSLVDKIGIIPLETQKENKIEAIKANTKVLIESKGFTYENVKYGCTQEDQNNWNTLVNTILTNKTLGATDEQIFPIVNEVKTWSGDYITMPSLAYINGIIMAGKEHVNSYRLSQTDLINQINLCENETQLNAILDNRT